MALREDVLAAVGEKPNGTMADYAAKLTGVSGLILTNAFGGLVRDGKLTLHKGKNTEGAPVITYTLAGK